MRPRNSTRGSKGALASDSENISTIRAGQGAKVTNRKNASEAAARARQNAEARYLKRHPEARAPEGGPERSRKNVLVLVGGAVLAMVVLFVVVRILTGILTPGPGEIANKMSADGNSTWSQTLNTEAPDQEPAAAQEQAAADGSVTYNGATYHLVAQESGNMGLVCTDSSGDTVLFEIEGTPVALMRNKGTLLIPENRNGGWDVVCYVVSGHSDPGYVVTMDGTMVTGSGDITSAQLDGSVIHVSDSTGASTDVTIE